jgi:hypothetical protein
VHRSLTLFALALTVALGAAVARAEIRELRVRLPSMPPPTGAERFCEKHLTVARTEGAEGCFIDERVTQAPGVLRYPCEGNGWVKAVFGQALFLGRLDGGQVDLVLNTEFDFSDRCEWTTDQHLRGALSSPALDYSYSEAPKPGQQGCANPCRATARAVFR